MVKSTRRIYTKTLMRQIQDIVKSKVWAELSIGSIHKLKPFYIENSTERERERKLSCIFCWNLRLRYNALQTHLKDKSKKSDTLSDYCLHGTTCEKEPNGFYQLKYVSAESEKCSMKDMFENDDFTIPASVKYEQFVRDDYIYMGKDGTEKTGNRTVRKQFEQSFDSNRVSYLIHRFECVLMASNIR